MSPKFSSPTEDVTAFQPARPPLTFVAGAVFGEFGIPLLKEARWAKELTLTLAARHEQFKQGGTLPTGEQTLSGVLVAAEAADVFTPAADTAKRIDWIRNPARLATLAGVTGPVMPALVDLPATKPGDLPQGGETVVDFPNNHLGYAMTWFGFALLTPALLAAWIWQRLRRPPAASA